VQEVSRPAPQGEQNAFIHLQSNPHEAQCDPEDRDWEGQRQKCVVCRARGHPCGPNVSHPSRQHRTSSADNNLPHSLQTSPLSLPTPPSTAPNSSQQSSQYNGATSSWSPTSRTSGAYSPLAESPLQDRGKSKIGSSNTPQIGHDAGLPGPVEAIRNRQGSNVSNHSSKLD
jgi:hypothetical protein